MNTLTRMQLEQIANLKAEIADLNKRIKEMDFWFIKNIRAADWNDKINQYWLLRSKVEEKTEQRNRLSAGKPRLLHHHNEFHIPKQ